MKRGVRRATAREQRELTQRSRSLLHRNAPHHVVFAEPGNQAARNLQADALEQLGAPDTPCVYVDFSGNATLRRALHTRQTGLRHSGAIGGTHVAQLGSARDLPGPAPTLFFAPAQMAKRHTEGGASALQQRLVDGWQAFLATATAPQNPWLTAEHHHGAAAVQAAYQRVLGGQGSAQQGLVLHF